jgi:hypothetical protein
VNNVPQITKNKEKAKGKFGVRDEKLYQGVAYQKEESHADTETVHLEPSHFLFPVNMDR